MILVIDTKDQKQVSVTLKEGKKVLACLRGENEYGSQALLLLIMKILKVTKLDFKDLTGIEVETGPGSFTGLRVGATVAQALGFSLNIPVNGKIGKSIKLYYT
ncbi:tRNA (adenosine(37)-N6)-threonylcarbamoyltransferase complex dimerization subunit type 1 TsaB [Candidatus Daviesbacteria bacterium]|nr:tRNA (adenosine(37)-N6)-threonylcarbamoyltransferase complex dimerization subunit type 1 TsaB [Candidatus Daviesbacteria bacterium]